MSLLLDRQEGKTAGNHLSKEWDYYNRGGWNAGSFDLYPAKYICPFHPDYAGPGCSAYGWNSYPYPYRFGNEKLIIIDRILGFGSEITCLTHPAFYLFPPSLVYKLKNPKCNQKIIMNV
jgi:hypothetical protein